MKSRIALSVCALALAAAPALAAPLTGAQIKALTVHVAMAASMPEQSQEDCQAIADIEAKADPDPYWQGQLEFCWGDEKTFAEHDTAQACTHYEAAARFYSDPEAQKNRNDATELKIANDRIAGGNCS